MNININYHKWNKKNKHKLAKSCNEKLNIKEIQFYQPHFSLYFHIHNTVNSHKLIDIKRKYYLEEILEVTNKKYVILIRILVLLKKFFVNVCHC